MRYSVMIWPHSAVTFQPVVELTQLAERLGYDTVYIGDSQMIWNDVYVALTLCAAATRRVRLGPGVTNTVTRHPAVTANAIMCINIASHGRAVLGVGAGDSAVRTVGMSPAKLDTIRERVVFMRRLLAGEEIEPLVALGERREGTWGMVDRVHLEGAAAWGRVPIEIACMGPRSVEMTGEIADGVIVDGHMGANVEGVRATIAAARRGAERAGRDVGSLRIIGSLDVAIDDDRRAAIDQVLHTVARNISRKPYLPECIGVEHADVVEQVSEAYRFYQHLDLTAQHRKLIPDAVAMKCAIVGPAVECVAKIAELEAAGLTDIAIQLTAQDQAGSARRLERLANAVGLRSRAPAFDV